MPKSLMDEIMTVCLRRGILFPTAEIYGGLAGFYDLGPVGTRIRNNLIGLWRRRFIEMRDFVYEVSGATILPSEVFKASGHLDHFTDPYAECPKGHVVRADQLIEEKLGIPAEGKPNDELTSIIRDRGIRCPTCGQHLSEVKSFGLMFATQVGGERRQAFLRPETAQNIFLDFKRVQKATRAKLPFGIAQVGRSYRNEISPRQSVVRVREFEQMEIEYFIDPDHLDECPLLPELKDVELAIVTREAQQEVEKQGHRGDYKTTRVTVAEAAERGLVPNQWMACVLGDEMVFFQQLGMPREAIRFRHMRPEETPHYSGGNFDLEVRLSIGWKEVVGNAYRTDHDLRAHMKGSQKDLSVEMDGRKVVPHVIEPSFGVDRLLYCIMEHTFRRDESRGWSWFQFPPALAPYDAVILPLLERPQLEEKAHTLYRECLEMGLAVMYDGRGRIGRRYARADEIGIPTAVTIDPQTLEDNTATLRSRDTTEQTRHPLDEIPRLLLSQR